MFRILKIPILFYKIRVKGYEKVIRLQENGSGYQRRTLWKKAIGIVKESTAFVSLP